MTKLDSSFGLVGRHLPDEAEFDGTSKRWNLQRVGLHPEGQGRSGQVGRGIR